MSSSRFAFGERHPIEELTTLATMQRSFFHFFLAGDRENAISLLGQTSALIERADRTEEAIWDRMRMIDLITQGGQDYSEKWQRVGRTLNYLGGLFRKIDRPGEAERAEDLGGMAGVLSVRAR